MIHTIKISYTKLWSLFPKYKVYRYIPTSRFIFISYNILRFILISLEFYFAIFFFLDLFMFHRIYRHSFHFIKVGARFSAVTNKSSAWLDVQKQLCESKKERKKKNCQNQSAFLPRRSFLLTQKNINNLIKMNALCMSYRR